jgi:cellulose synthase (UDP-forming)
MKQRSKFLKNIFEIGLLFGLNISVVSIFIYLITRTTLYLKSEVSLLGFLIMVIIIIADGFILLHAIAYHTNMLCVLIAERKRDKAKEISKIQIESESVIQKNDLQREDASWVALLVASYREPIHVIEKTLICLQNLTYKNRRVYLLDDTRYDMYENDSAKRKEHEDLQNYKQEVDDLGRRLQIYIFRRAWRGAKAGIINDFLFHINKMPRPGSSLIRPHDEPEYYYTATDPEKYITVFDADMNALPCFLEPIVAKMEENDNLAFIQTPQYYTNTDYNRVSRGAGLQQAIFYEYICEGKSIKGALPCCGTNVIFRTKALWDIGGFDETSVTEDFATSLILHTKGWESSYLNRVSAFGLGPEDLGGYFKQQHRWALGSVNLFKSVVIELFKDPKRLKPILWFEYFVSGSYYIVGWSYLIMILTPIIYILFGIPESMAHPELYYTIFYPYFLLTLLAFLIPLLKRGYRFGEIFLGVLLTLISIPVYIKASTQALLGIKGKFAVTPKEGSTILPLKYLWPHISLIMLNLAAVVWAVLRFVYDDKNKVGIIFNGVWCLFYFINLSFVFYFNYAEEKVWKERRLN